MSDAFSILNEYMRDYMAAQTARMALYPMSETDVDEEVYVSIEDVRRYDCDEMPVSAYIAELQDLISKVPDGCQPVIEFERDYDWDDDGVTVRKIGYWRVPTPEERAEREKHNAEAREHNANLATIRIAETEAAEKAEFVRLAAKYGK